jgi:hypothetical protein
MPVRFVHPVVTTSESSTDHDGEEAASGDGVAPCQLLAIDDVLAEYHLERRVALEVAARAAADRDNFERAATHALRNVVKPALASVAARLDADGAGGRVDERPASSRHGPRLVLWMSLDGPIVTARQDRNPYLQLDLDVPERHVRVWEGDMWLGSGASRPAPALSLPELTSKVVTDRAIAVLRRAADRAQRLMTTNLAQEGDAL